MRIIKVEDYELSIKEFRGHRVVTLKDIDVLHKRPANTAGNNFQNNKNHFLESVDYFILKPSDQNEFPYQKIPNRGLIILTQSGYLMLAKTFTDKIAWTVQREMVNSYFVSRVEEPEQRIKAPSSVEDLIIMQAQSVKELKSEVAELKALQQSQGEKMENVQDAVNTFADSIIQAPDSTIVTRAVNELSRWTRMEFEDIRNKGYEMLKQKHGIDIPRRVNNERDRIQAERVKQKGRPYADSTLKSKVNGVDLMVREDCLHLYYEVLVAWLAKEKSKSKLRLVQ